MKIGVCGDLDDETQVFAALDYWDRRLQISQLLIGDDTGAMLPVQKWADARRLKLIVVTSDRKLYGRAAGERRNETLLRNHKPDRILAFPGGDDRDGMLKLAQRMGVLSIEIV